jgi:hypothetical protein
MLSRLILAAVYSCPVLVGFTHVVAVNVYYEHEGIDGRAYSYRTVQLLEPGLYDVVPEGHPVGIEWSDGTFCGLRAELVFRDNFESGSTAKWVSKQGG